MPTRNNTADTSNLGSVMPTQATPHGAPTRRYMNEKITRHLLEGMKRVAIERLVSDISGRPSVEYMSDISTVGPASLFASLANFCWSAVARSKALWMALMALPVLVVPAMAMLEITCSLG